MRKKVKPNNNKAAVIIDGPEGVFICNELNKPINTDIKPAITE